MNKELKKQVKGLQGGMMEQAEKHPLPEKFKTKPNKKGNGVIITNVDNGNKFHCPLYAYGNVREALTNLL